MADFEFTPDHDGTVPLRVAVFQALGAASTCWEKLDRAGVFDDARAVQIGEKLLERIKQEGIS